jgi:hypothetical protein
MPHLPLRPSSSTIIPPFTFKITMVRGKREALLIALQALSWLELVQSLAAPKNYLDSLNSGKSNSVPIPPDNERERLAPEEFYGCTNPMANNWPGSKHEEYGGYLKRLGDAKNENGIHETNENDIPHNTQEWHLGTSNLMAGSEGYENPKRGGYLDNL